MTTMQATSTHRIEDATAPLWVGFGPRGWGDVVRDVRNDRPATAGEVIRTAGLDWRVEQYPVEAVIPPAPGGDEPCRVGVPRMLANVRSDTGAVLGVVGDGYRPLQNGDAFALADALVDSGEAHWIGAGSTRGGARVHALMRLDREITIGGATGEDLLPLLLVRNGHDGGLAVTVSVAPFRLACLNGMIVPIEGAARTWKARHTRRIDEKLADARRSLAIAWRYYDALEDLGAQLLAAPLGPAAFDRFLHDLIPDPPTEVDRDGRRQRNAAQIREEIHDVYQWTPDLETYLNVKPWSVGDYELGLNADGALLAVTSSFKWRYITLNGHYVLGHDLRGGYHDWVFVRTSCLYTIPPASIQSPTTHP